MAMIDYIVSYLFLFFLYSTGGWLIETVYRTATDRRITNPGFLTGPYVPIYGFGAMLIIAISNIIFTENIFARIGLYFVFMTAIEFITGELLYLIYKKRYWDYSGYRFNFRGILCLRFSIYWTLLSIGFELLIYPLSQALLDIIQHDKVFKITVAMMVLYSADIFGSTGLAKRTFRMIKLPLKAAALFMVDRSGFNPVYSPAISTGIRKISSIIENRKTSGEKGAGYRIAARIKKLRKYRYALTEKIRNLKKNSNKQDPRAS